MANEDVQKTLEELSRDLQESKARLEEAQRIAQVGRNDVRCTVSDGEWLFAERLLYVDWIEERFLA